MPLVRDLLAWLRFYTLLPIPPIAGESAAEAASRAMPESDAAVQAVPLAGAVLGAVGGIVLVIAAAAQLPAFVSVVLALGALAAITGAAAESGFADACRRAGKRLCPDVNDARLLHAGVSALVFALLLRVALLEGLLAAGSIKAALALIAAGAVARAAAAGVPAFVATEAPAGEPAAAAPAASAHLQYLALFALAIVAIAILPTYGVGAALGGLVVAVVVAALAANLAQLIGANGERGFAAGVEFAAETAFLFAVLVIARIP